MCGSVDLRWPEGPSAYPEPVIFKRVGEGRPYPDHGRRSAGDWADVPPRPVRLDELVTTKRTLDLDHLLAEDSTFFGDLFPHVVSWRGEFYLEDGLHRAVRTALAQRTSMHARVLALTDTVARDPNPDPLSHDLSPLPPSAP
jgi:Arc/MetJ family transcription regulator